jgi:hypothetical protein
VEAGSVLVLPLLMTLMFFLLGGGCCRCLSLGCRVSAVLLGIWHSVEITLRVDFVDSIELRWMGWDGMGFW